MEQAVNTFTKGLLSDTHPMVQGNDTLSDALNATFITMNGNEVVLLNDMGNRRVDNAFLPAGYEPVGIKEYGGIIYVAAYNPITNRSQIGSFPSPERKGKGDIEPLTIDFSDFIDNTTKKLKTKEIIIQITKNSLRAGDKFSIYSNNNILLSITNLFKLNVGILNSLNEFLDITNDLLKFNDSFIEIRNNNNDLPINDENFMLTRLALPINTYSYKLVSPLYLRVKINTFNTVVWNIEGDKDINENITLYPTATYIFEDGFNVPNDFPASIKIENKDIYLAEEPESRLIDGNTVIVTYKSIKFIKEESNYKYNNELSFTFENNIIEYNIYSYLFHNGFYVNEEGVNEEIIVDETSGSKDISKLNSDTIEFNGWRYYNKDNGITEGTLDINIYAKHNDSKLESFGAKFELDNEIINIILINFSDKTNRFEFNRTDNYFTPRTLYNVEFYYKRDGAEIKLDNQSSLFITTALFNKSYLGTEDFIYDLKYLTLEENNNLLEGSKIQDLSIITRINYSYHQHQNVYIQDFCKIKQILIYPIVLWDYSNSQNIITSSENDIFNDTESYVTYNDIVENTTDINPHFLVENSELYPYINIEYGTIKNFNFQIKTYDGKTLDEINDSLVDYTGANSNLVSDKTIIENSKTIDGSTGITIKQTYKIKNIAKGPSVNRTITLNNVMTSFYNFASKNSLIGTTKPYFCIDNEGGEYYDISVVSDEDSTYGEHNAKKLIGNMENGNKYHYSTNSLLISDYIISHGNNNSLFASELNTDDIVMVDSESFPVLTTDNSLGGIRTLVHYRRVWIRINSETFIPFIVSGIEGDEDTLDFNNVHTLLNNECKKIPHIYVYKLGNESFNTKVLDINQSYKTKEFNISIKNKFKYKIESITTNVTNGNNSYNISDNYNYGFLGVDTDSYNEKEDEYQERNLISNLNFQDFIELLSTYHFDTGYKYGDNYNKYILFDNEGKLLDSKYVYKEIEEGVIQKVYIPSTKFTISNDMYLPNLTYDGTLTNNESGRTYGYIVSTTVIGSNGLPTQEPQVYNYVTTKEDAIVMVQREENQHISLVFDKIPDIYHIGDL